MGIRIVERTGSTNADMLVSPGAVEGDWLVARVQEAGKGRQGRAWLSALGNFSGSTLVELRSADPPAQLLSLVAGLALADAIDAALPGQPLMLKWPNDLLLDGYKLAGILLERSGNRGAVGFGVNLASAPPLDDRLAADLGGLVSPDAFAPLLAASFARRLADWRGGDSAALIGAWATRAHPLGTPLTVHAGADQMVSGRFAGLAADGALLLDRGDGSTETIHAGDVALG